MASVQPTGTCHVVAIPYAGRGHINALMNLCKLLASRSNHIAVSFVVTEEWLGFLDSETTPPNFRFRTVPNVLPSELGRAADQIGFVRANTTKLEEPFERILDRLEQPPNLIVADTFLTWAIGVGSRRNIPTASFWPMPATVFSIFYHHDLLVQNGHFPVDLPGKGDEVLDYIPGVSSIKIRDIPSIFHNKDQTLLNLALHCFFNLKNAPPNFLLFNTTPYLEPSVVQALQVKLKIPIYSLGPLIPYPDLEQQNPVPKHDYFTWLDSQSTNSTLYISLGSFLSVSAAQMAEFVAGIKSSGVPYLLVSRDNTVAENGVGKVVNWCDQLRVLCHPSIGGFWTHCGWNSTVEGLYAGVPMLTSPILMDQTTVSKMVVEDWKIGWRMERENGEVGLVGRERVAEIVRRFMDPEDGERREMVGRANEARESCRRAIEEGGSSELDFQVFVEKISK